MAEWETLQRLMPPGPDGGTPVDWAAMAESWGRDFPADYKRFVAAYGYGTIQAFLVVAEPEPKGAQPRSPLGGMQHETANAELMWTHAGKAPELADASPLLIAWGADAGADVLCWDATDPDPDSWPVLVAHRGDSLWRRYDFGMVEFLARLLHGDFADCPLSGTDLCGVESAKFLTLQQEQQAYGQGIDPWAG